MMNASPRPGRRGPRLLLALALGLAAAAGVFMYVNAIQQQAQVSARTAAQQATAAASSRTRVVVAKISLAAGTALSPDNVELREIPAEAIQPNVAIALNDVTGKALTVPVAAGEQILSHRLGSLDQPEIKKFADTVPAGKRAMSVTFTEVSSAGGLIAPGDYVDVIGVFNKSTMGKDQSMILLQDVLVLAVAQNTSADQLPRQGSATGTQPVAPAQTNLPLPTRGGSTVAIPQPTPASFPFAPAQTRTVTLAVDPEAAERLALAEDYGHLRYIVRPGSERTQSAVMPADLTTLASPIQVAAGQIISTEISPTNTKVGDTLDIKITVRNTSDKPLQTMGPEPGFTYIQGQTYFTQQFKTTNFWAALINEPSSVVQQGVGMTLVTSLPQNLAIVAVDAANVRSSPSIAASVLDQVKYGTELQIVGQSADWFKVKLPDQREGWVAAGWIVTAGQ